MLHIVTMHSAFLEHIHTLYNSLTYLVVCNNQVCQRIICIYKGKHQHNMT